MVSLASVGSHLENAVLLELPQISTLVMLAQSNLSTKEGEAGNSDRRGPWAMTLSQEALEVISKPAE